MQQVLFRIPIPWAADGLPIYGFGMMLFLAFLICTWIAGRRAEREGVPRETIQDLVIWLFLGGLLGARLLYLFEEKPTPSFWEVLVKLPQIWKGGIILYGAVLGALLAYLIGYWLVFRKKGLSTLQLADIIAPSVALGLCLGRIGCFLNGCCYGQVACAEGPVCPVHFPLSAPARYALVSAGYQTCAGFTFASAGQYGTGVKVGQVQPESAAWRAGLRPGDVIEEADGKPMLTREDLDNYLFGNWPQGKTELTLLVAGKDRPITFAPRTLGLHPTQLYETISMFLLFLFLSAVYPLRKQQGQIIALLMICYGLHRFFNEMLRNDERPVELESVSSLILILAGLVLAAILFLRKPRPVGAPVPVNALTNQLASVNKGR